MKRLVLTLLALAVAVLFAAFAGQRANAISRQEDVIRDLTTVFSEPSAFPPNNALRPFFNGPTNQVRQPYGFDIGPGREDRPETLPVRGFRFVVALIENEQPAQEGYVCAGALIAPEWVLTAAHCTYAWTQRWPFQPEVYALFDTARLAEPGPRVRVLQVIPHPAYDPHTLRNDVALLRIAKDQIRAPPIQLEGPPPSEQVGAIGHVLGWGVTNTAPAERRATEALQVLQVLVRDPDACFAGYNFPQLRGSGAFCASSLLRYHDICYRFGGGPLFLRDKKGARYLAGLVSWPAVCPPAKDKMNAFLDVQRYVPWIKSTIQANGGPG